MNIFNKGNIKRMMVLFLIVTMTIFLFVGGNSAAEESHRLLKDIWDMGHLVLFGLLSFSYFKLLSKNNTSLKYQFVFTTLFCFVVGTAVEFIQLFIQRDFSLDDIINDVIGGYLGLLSLIIINKQYSVTNRLVSVIAFVIFFSVGIRSIEIHLLDEYRMYKQFPVLAEFETSSELQRWEFSRVNVHHSDRYIMSGKHSLKVEFLTGQYPTISLNNLKSDWSGYKELVFSVFNPNKYDLKFEVKIFDKKHRDNGGYYNDRFNKNITLRYGWNIFEISIADILNSPKQRLMNIEKIKTFSLFTNNLKKPQTIYIDHIYLE